MLRIDAAPNQSNFLVAFGGDQRWYRDDLLAQVMGLRLAIRRLPQENFVICCDNSYWFCCALLAAWCEQRTVFMPANSKPSTLDSIIDPEETGLISDHIIDNFSSLIASEIEPVANYESIHIADAKVYLFTSGSSGTPKRITKNLRQLTAELDDLAKVFGEFIRNSAFLATVSHQHIYGLLFRVLLPLSLRCPFGAEFHEYPETLVAATATLEKLSVERAVWVSSPAHLKRMPELVDLTAIGDKLALVFSSGGPLSLDAATRFYQAANQDIHEVLGSTETGGVAYRIQRQSNLWQRFPSVEIKSDDRDALLVRSPFLETAHFQALGNRVELVDDQHFHLHERIDRIVKVEEKRLSLPELERRLQKHPAVQECAALVIEGKRATVCVVAQLSAKGQALLEQQGKRQVTETLRHHLESFYETVLLPKKWRFVDTLPYNAQGKLPVAQLSALFQS
mgnify:CR=1 FL=1